jgi:ubiquinone/menaquinone biosynthesis C-methylase UbiE
MVAMPAMSKFEVATCRSAPWRWFARRVVLPWGLDGFVPRGDVLEIGAGSGAMAAEVLARHPDVTLTVTDFDEVMVRAAADRLGDRARVQPADATALPFADGSFDVVVSWIMLHHTVDWERALREALRVLRPGGSLVGYDLVATAPLRALHRGDDTHRMMRVDELRAEAAALALSDARITGALGGALVRFRLTK